MRITPDIRRLLPTKLLPRVPLKIGVVHGLRILIYYQKTQAPKNYTFIWFLLMGKVIGFMHLWTDKERIHKPVIKTALLVQMSLPVLSVEQVLHKFVITVFPAPMFRHRAKQQLTFNN